MARALTLLCLPQLSSCVSWQRQAELRVPFRTAQRVRLHPLLLFTSASFLLSLNVTLVEGLGLPQAKGVFRWSTPNLLIPR